MFVYSQAFVCNKVKKQKQIGYAHIEEFVTTTIFCVRRVSILLMIASYTRL